MKFYKQIMIDIYAYSIVLSLTILFRQSFVSVAVIVHYTDVKGKRFSAQPPDLFTFNKVCTNLMDEQGNRRLTVCNFHIDLQMLFSISPNFSESCSMS